MALRQIISSKQVKNVKFHLLRPPIFISRCFSSQIVVGEKKVLIPKPKRPLTPYFRYLGDVRKDVKVANPSSTPTEILRIVAQQWESLDPVKKEAYTVAYKNDMERFSSILEEYNDSLTPSQKEAALFLRVEKSMKNEQKKRLKKMSNMKVPANVFQNTKPISTGSVCYQQVKSQEQIEDWKLPIIQDPSKPSQYVLKYSTSESKENKFTTISTVKNDEKDETVLSKHLAASLNLQDLQPVQIVNSENGQTFHLDENSLSKLLFQNDVKDLPVAIISISGAFRKGKSFLLDFFIRYLRSLQSGNGNWIGKPNDPLVGFSWRGGSELDTTGILLWSEIFKIKKSSGQEVAVILMDTQGAFDCQSTVRDCATIFALSTMTSSVQIYNLSQNIQEDDLQHLQLFTEYGRLAMKDSSETPFQKLCFLVRDWSYPYEAPYGFEGGKTLLERRLEVSEKQHNELQSLRKHIKACFNEISCFLMPHPGLKAATNPSFDGRISDIEPEFLKQLETLVPFVLAPDNLVVKNIGGLELRTKDLLHYFQAYTAVFKGTELPEPKTMLEATARADNLLAAASARELYATTMDDICGSSMPYVSSERLEADHERYREKAMNLFKARRKMGGEEFALIYRDALEKEIDDLYLNFRGQNDNKNILKSARTPVTLFALANISYITSGIFGLVGLSTLSNMFNLSMGVSLSLIGFRCYTWYTGKYARFSKQIDQFSTLIWTHILKPTYSKLLVKGAEKILKKKR